MKIDYSNLTDDQLTALEIQRESDDRKAEFGLLWMDKLQPRLQHIGVTDDQMPSHLDIAWQGYLAGVRK